MARPHALRLAADASAGGKIGSGLIQRVRGGLKLDRYVVMAGPPYLSCDPPLRIARASEPGADVPSASVIDFNQTERWNRLRDPRSDLYSLERRARASPTRLAEARSDSL